MQTRGHLQRHCAGHLRLGPGGGPCTECMRLSWAQRDEICSIHSERESDRCTVRIDESTTECGEAALPCCSLMVLTSAASCAAFARHK